VSLFLLSFEPRFSTLFFLPFQPWSHILHWILVPHSRAAVEEALLNVAREADLSEILHKTWQAENPDFLLCRTRQTSACHCGSPSCPRTAAFRLPLCLSLSPVSPLTFVLTFLSSIAMGAKGF
jgi:hypothetical protein